MMFSQSGIHRFWKLMLLACLSSRAEGLQANPSPTGSLAFAVADGNCSPGTSGVSAGLVAITVTLTSSPPQTISLVTTGNDAKHLLQHTQVGTSETWSTIVQLPAGSYQLTNSVGTSKCSVTVN
jgi:hypothetical protein